MFSDKAKKFRSERFGNGRILLLRYLEKYNKQDNDIEFTIKSEGLYRFEVVGMRGKYGAGTVILKILLSGPNKDIINDMFELIIYSINDQENRDINIFYQFGHWELHNRNCGGSSVRYA